MRHFLVISLLLSSLLFSVLEGIRLEKGFKAVGNLETNNPTNVEENEGKTSSKGFSDEIEENGMMEKKKKPKNIPQSLGSHQHYVDLTEISEMDYSPARRKSPIHN